MAYECENCGWTSGDEMPTYRFAHQDGTRVQVAHCPDCQCILDTRENTARAI